MLLHLGLQHASSTTLDDLEPQKPASCLQRALKHSCIRAELRGTKWGFPLNGSDTDRSVLRSASDYNAGPFMNSSLSGNSNLRQLPND